MSFRSPISGRPATPTGPLAAVFAVAVAASAALSPALAEGDVPRAWPRGKVFLPKRLFKKDADSELDQAVRAANPRLYLYDDFDPGADKILVVGMPGWGGRSENFIHILINGLKGSGASQRLVIAAIQDPATGGPQYQGQGAREHANVWTLDRDSVAAMRRFVAKLAAKLGPGTLQVYLFGFSSGGIAAPLVAARIARWSRADPYEVEGSIAMGTGTRIWGGTLKAKKQRLLFVVVPPRLPEDKEAMRDDQRNRKVATRSYQRLKKTGADVQLRHIYSAKRHVDWHWGLISQCRYFRTKRIDPGRGYWPNYWMPNPETMAYIAAFVQGKPVPKKAAPERQKCPY